VRVAKYMSQCLTPSQPRGCDGAAAAADPPRGRGWQRVARITKDWLDSLPAKDDMRLQARWRTCAVVGNGGSLLMHTLGKRIDAADAVIRFNGGVTKGFEPHVGRRTTVRLANTQHLGFFEAEDEAGGVLRTPHSTDVESPPFPSRVCLSILPEGTR